MPRDLSEGHAVLEPFIFQWASCILSNLLVRWNHSLSRIHKESDLDRLSDFQTITNKLKHTHTQAKVRIINGESKKNSLPVFALGLCWLQTICQRDKTPMLSPMSRRRPKKQKKRNINKRSKIFSFCDYYRCVFLSHFFEIRVSVELYCYPFRAFAYVDFELISHHFVNYFFLFLFNWRELWKVKCILALSLVVQSL